MTKQHRYSTTVEWIGNTGAGTASYKAYERAHVIQVPGKPPIPGSSDPAFRGDPARTPGSSGGGLGLAIARGLVTAHDGTIAVRNAGEGCCFTVRVPRLGTSSFDIEYRARCNGKPACTGTITYVSVIPGTHDSTPIPEEIRSGLAEHP